METEFWKEFRKNFKTQLTLIFSSFFKNRTMIDNYLETFNGKSVKLFEVGESVDSQHSYKVECPYDAEVSVIDKLKDLTGRGLSNQLEELIIGAWQDSFETSCSEILSFLIENKSKFPNLKHAFVGDMTSEDCEISWINQANYEEFFKAFPQLETFQVRGGQDLEFGGFSLPNLKRLVIETGGLDKSVIESLVSASSSLTNLAHLEIWLGEENYGATVSVDNLKVLLEKPFPNLKYLGLKNSDMQNEVVGLMKNHPILNQLETLDLSMGTLTNDGAKALLENESLLKLKYLNCRHHFIEDEWVAKLKIKFASQNINLNDQENVEDDWLYVEVGE
jgi:hypothetical protein